MQRKVSINFPDGFEFPKEYDYEHCGEKCVFCHCDMYECVEYCTISDENNRCPFYDRGEDETIEI